MAKSGRQAIPMPCSAIQMSGSAVIALAVLGCSVAGNQRNTLGRQIGRRCHKASAICAQSPGHQPRVAKLREAHDSVEALLNHIDNPIAEIELQSYLVIDPHEGYESWHHQHADQWQADT